ncbi:MAG: hypothetical protein ACXADC_06955 [Candidatus Thorarchaeota archaeon]|jgi:hypothetical protein
MAITVIPFFSSLTPKSFQDDASDKLRTDGVEIVMPDDYTAMVLNEPKHDRGPIYLFIGSD